MTDDENLVDENVNEIKYYLRAILTGKHGVKIVKSQKVFG